MAARPKLLIVGAGGHGRVVLDIVLEAGIFDVAGVVDSHVTAGTGFLSTRVIGTEADLPSLCTSLGVVAIAIAIGDNAVRAAVVSRISATVPHAHFPALVHPAAVVSRFATIGDGSVLCARASVGAASAVGRFCILNTASSLDHDGAMEDFASLAPGAVTGGSACIGHGAAVCIGATVAHGGIRVGEGSVVGADSLLLDSVPPWSVAYGSPAQVVRARGVGDSYLHKPRSAAAAAAAAATTALAETRDAAAPAAGVILSLTNTAASTLPAPLLQERPSLPPPKTSVADLTLFNVTSPPSFPTFVPVGRPNLGPKATFQAFVDGLWESAILTNGGPLVQRLEAEVAAFLRVKHFIACCNCTVALDIAAHALGWAGGGEVIVPAYTFVATAHVLRWRGVTPVFCDVDPHTHLLDPAAVEALVTPRTVGILGVHLWGLTCDVEALQAVADRHGLRLAFDAAQAFGSSRGGIPVGNFGDLEAFSFHATKLFTSGEGGGLATNDDELAQRCRIARNFGLVDYDKCAALGVNGKMPEMSAALGLTNLPLVPGIIAHNQTILAHYRLLLGALPGLTVLQAPDAAADADWNAAYVVVKVDAVATGGLTRDDLVGVLVAENFSARRYFFPGCHRMEPYVSEPGVGATAATLPITAVLCERVMCLPTGLGVTIEHVEAAAAVLSVTLRNAAVAKECIRGLAFPLPLGPGMLPPLIEE